MKYLILLVALATSALSQLPTYKTPGVNGENVVPATFRAALGLGTAATTDASAYLPKPATSAGRYMGLRAAGPPTSGDYLQGDFVMTQRGDTWVCVGTGSPGTWVMPGQNTWQPIGLSAQNVDYANQMSYPGTVTTAGPMFKDRIHAVTFPLKEYLGISQIQVCVTIAGEAGSKIRLGVYDDFRGRPGLLLASVVVAADTTGVKVGNLSPNIPGGQWVWLCAVAQDCPTTPPTINRINNSPYRVHKLSLNTYDAANNLIAYWKNGITGALPVRWPANQFQMDCDITAPWFGMKFTWSPFTNHEPDRFPVMVPEGAEEENTLQEPSVYYDASLPEGRKYVMFFSSGWTTGDGIRWADAPSVDGPWTRRGFYPGGGKSSILHENGTLYLYNSGAPGPRVRVGNSPGTLGPLTPVTLNRGAFTSLNVNVFNTSVIKDGDNSYIMMFDGSDDVTQVGLWQAGMARGTSPLGPFTVEAWPLTSLRQTIAGGATGGLTSAGDLHKENGIYKLWYHGSDGGNAPNELFYAESTDCINWTPNPKWVARRTHQYEYDQIADPFMFRDPATGIDYLFWDALQNQTPAWACIMRSNPAKFSVTPAP